MNMDPKTLFDMVANTIPRDLHGNILIVGSLAAAFHYRAKLTGQAVATKDADVVVHPAGSVHECAQIAKRLLEAGWSRVVDPPCRPQPEREPVETLRAIRLQPKDIEAFFVELIGMPPRDQREAKRWTPCQLVEVPEGGAGWYGIPSFRFMALLESDRRRTEYGIEHASPPLMALANLLSHQRVGEARIESGEQKGLLRSAKDLGRVLSLFWLEDRAVSEGWPDTWERALRAHFADEARALAANAGAGLRELLAHPTGLDDAYATTNVGLLRGHDVTPERLKIAGEQILQDLIDPLADRFR